MSRHLSEADVIDVAEGGAGDWRAHLDACPRCASEVSGARAMLGLVAETPAPEPSPLFWDALRERVAAGILAPRPERTRWWLAPVGLIAAAAAALLIVPRSPVPPVVVTAPTLTAWSALPADADEDASLQVLDGVVAQADDLPATVCDDVSECVATMSDEESAALAALVRQELARGDRS